VKNKKRERKIMNLNKAYEENLKDAMEQMIKDIRWSISYHQNALDMFELQLRVLEAKKDKGDRNEKL